MKACVKNTATVVAALCILLLNACSADLELDENSSQALEDPTSATPNPVTLLPCESNPAVQCFVNFDKTILELNPDPLIAADQIMQELERALSLFFAEFRLYTQHPFPRREVNENDTSISALEKELDTELNEVREGYINPFTDLVQPWGYSRAPWGREKITDMTWTRPFACRLAGRYKELSAELKRYREEFVAPWLACKGDSFANRAVILHGVLTPATSLSLSADLVTRKQGCTPQELQGTQTSKTSQ